MDNISDILTSLSITEFNKLDKYFDEINSSKDRKDKKLLKILKRDEDLQTDDIIRELYDIDPNAFIPSNKRNSYHQWRSILSDHLDNFIVQQIDSGDTSQYIVKLMSIARFLFFRKKYNLAFKYLQKAESIAQKMERYELLQRIYSIQIDYAWSQSGLDLNLLLKKWEDNTELERKETAFNAALGVLKKQLRIVQFKEGSVDFNRIVSEILHTYNVNIEIEHNVSNQYRITKILQVALEENGEYPKLLDYMVKIYHKLEDENLFTKHNQLIKIKFLNNIFFFACKCLKSKTAEKYFDLLKQTEEKNSHLNFINIKRLVSEVGFLALTNRLHQAIDLLNKGSINPQVKTILKEDDFQFVRFYCNVFRYSFFNSDNINSQKAMSKLLNNEQKLKGSFGYRFFVCTHIVDCLLQIEKKDPEHAYNKICALQKRFKAFLSQTENSYYKEVIDILKLMVTKPEIIFTNTFSNRIDECIKNKPLFMVKHEIIPFNIFLLSKIKKRPVYDLFLESVLTNQ